jgi:hypothetical protein
VLPSFTRQPNIFLHFFLLLLFMTRLKVTLHVYYGRAFTNTRYFA